MSSCVTNINNLLLKKITSENWICSYHRVSKRQLFDLNVNIYIWHFKLLFFQTKWKTFMQCLLYYSSSVQRSKIWRWSGANILFVGEQWRFTRGMRKSTQTAASVMSVILLLNTLIQGRRGQGRGPPIFYKRGQNNLCPHKKFIYSINRISLIDQLIIIRKR